MIILLEIHRPGLDALPVRVTTDEAVPVSQVARALCEAASDSRRDHQGSLSIGIHDVGGVLSVAPDSTMGESGLRSGMRVSIVSVDADPVRAGSPAAAVVLRILAGPEHGREIHLPSGASVIGRDRSCSVRLADPTVSKRHARINAGDTLEVIDLNSANGIFVDGVLAPRSDLKVGNTFGVGETELQVVRFQERAGHDARPFVPIVRSPRVDPVFGGGKYPAPEPPQPVRPQRIPWLGLAAPLMFGALLFFVTRNLASLVFVALSPVMMIGSAVESRWAAKREFAKAREQFAESMAAFREEMLARSAAEQRVRLAESPGTSQCLEAIRNLSPLLWVRRSDRPGFLQIRLGTGKQVSRSQVEASSPNRTTPALWRQLGAVADEFRHVSGVPIIADLATAGALGIAGPTAERNGVARGLLLQLLALHSPSDLVLMAIAPTQAAAEWDWLTWVPHVRAAGTLVAGEPLAAAPGAAITLLAELESFIELRSEDRALTDKEAPLPAVVVLVDHDAPADRARLVELSERGASVGVFPIWLAPDVTALPAVCRSFVAVTEKMDASTGDVVARERIEPVQVEPVDLPTAESLSRKMASWVDVGVPGESGSALPTSASFLEIAGEQLATSAGVLERWRETGSLHSETAGQRRRLGTLRALVGRNASDAHYLDLRSQGPHALVGGTTGSGKSELLQTWILGMATAHSPERVTFLLVDYKGGSAFAECVNLPHCVGLVTDLTPHLVQRAIRSLNAELRHREHVLHKHRAKDLAELEKSGHPETMPSLVIVVDEFAALVADVPEFVEGMVNIAQRGRSLGLHLILATQRPAGVIRDNLRANTNLRVALRLADADDSNDVIGSDLASTFPQDTPGRAVLRTGPGRLTPFQTAYVGGWSDDDDSVQVLVEENRFGMRRPLVGAADDNLDRRAALGPTDIQRMVAAARGAASEAEIVSPRRPWLPELAATYRLLDLPMRRTDQQLVIGARDEPDEQRQSTAVFEPDTDGNMVVFGTGGAGKSVVLRTIAAAAGLTARSGACQVYALDFGARGLNMLEELPHVGSVIPGDDHERVARLLRWLRGLIDERALRYAKVNASTITEYRTITERNEEPRVVVLVDGLAAFRQAYEVGPESRWFDVFQAIAADGRQVGVHLVVSADRPGAVPTGLASVIQRRLVLRLASESDLALVGVANGALTADSPPGRGFLDGQEVQVAVLGGDPNVAEQARQTASLARRLRRGGVAEAPPIRSLPERILLTSLPEQVAGQAALGLSDDTLGPVGFTDRGVMLVTGPPHSGRTTTVATMVASYRRAHPGAESVLLTGRRSALPSVGGWSSIAQGDVEVTDRARDLVRVLAEENGPRSVVVIEGVADFLNGDAESVLQELVRMCRDYDHLLIAEAENSSLGGSWGLTSNVKAARQGIALQPDQLDGDTVFRTPFPRVSRSEFPPGRGFLVAGGRPFRVQVALPG